MLGVLLNLSNGSGHKSYWRTPFYHSKPNSELVSVKHFPLPSKVSHSLLCAVTESYIYICNIIYIVPYFFVCVSISVPIQTVSFAKQGWCSIISVLLTPSTKGSIHFCSNPKISKLCKFLKCKNYLYSYIILADIIMKEYVTFWALRKDF